MQGEMGEEVRRFLVAALGGPAGCGKSTLARAVCDLPWQAREAIADRVAPAASDAAWSWGRDAFAAPIRAMLRAAFGLADEDMADLVAKESADPRLCGRTRRHAMRTLGTEWGRRMIGEDLWADALLRRVASAAYGGGPVVVDDLRFANEAALVADAGGAVIHVARAGGPRFTGDHPSERGEYLGFAHCSVDAAHPGAAEAVVEVALRVRAGLSVEHRGAIGPAPEPAPFLVNELVRLATPRLHALDTLRYAEVAAVVRDFPAEDRVEVLREFPGGRVRCDVRRRGLVRA
jgi:hypothetical protein